MGHNPTRRRLTIAILVSLLALGSTNASRGDPADDSDLLRLLGERFAAENCWEKACEVYGELLVRDPANNKTHAAYLTCLRHVLLIRRYEDPSVLDLVLRQDVRTLEKMYLEVIEKLRNNYADEQKAQLASLFQGGLDQLQLALSDHSFRKRWIPGATTAALRDFERRLATFRDARRVRDTREARTKALEVVAAAHGSLGLRREVTLLELAAGACASLDENTVLLSPKQLREMGNGATTETATVGLDIVLVGRKPIVAQVVTGGPAAVEGVVAGDRIVRIDGQKVDGLSASEIRERLQGPLGTSVEVQVRAPNAEPRQLKLTRQVLGAPSIQAQLLNAQRAIGYVQIASFEKSSPQELDEAILHLRAEGIRALIIDLRDNPGGSLEAAVQVVERFIPDGVIVCTQSHVGQYRRTYRAHNSDAWSIPLVVLTNPGTASAAEVAASAWKERRRATLVGEPTFGKACIQGTLSLETVPVGVRLTIARFFSPHGKNYGGRGVTPDILITQPLTSLHDEQLEAAVQEAIRHTDDAQ